MRVSQYLIVIPVLAQVAVTLTVWVTHWLAEAKGSNTPSLTAAKNQQFELPLLFYTACAFAYSFRLVDEWQLLLALGFVLALALGMLRGAYSAKPATLRASLALAALAVTAMWLKIAAHFATAGF